MTRRPLPQWLRGVLATLATLLACVDTTVSLRPNQADPNLAKGRSGPTLSVAALPTVPGYPAGGTNALDINVSGMIVGWGPDPTNTTTHATRWTMTGPGSWVADDLHFLLPNAIRSSFRKITAAGTLLGGFTAATVNNSTLIVGGGMGAVVWALP